MRGIFGIDPGWGITLLRLMTAIVFIVSGSGKWAAGVAATTAGFAKVGIPASGIAAPFIMILELGGGIFLFLGLFTRGLGLLFAVEMAVTAFLRQVSLQHTSDPKSRSSFNANPPADAVARSTYFT